MAETPEMRAYMESLWKDGTITKPQTAMMSLLNNPESFLKKYPIVNTFDCAAHGQTNAYFSNGASEALRPGSRLGTANMHKTESFKLESVSGVNDYGYSFPVHGVYMSPGHVAPVWYQLSQAGPALMLTAKLTGCTFVARAAGGTSVEVTHLQPGGGVNGLQLHQNMQTPGNATYGRENYDLDTRSINILGVRHGGRWSIWVQKLVKNSHTPTVLSVRRLWPV